jgi:GR25 family glycosyltransferase involved in LPS biosynthesis
MKIEKIFICHYSKLVDRRNLLEKQMRSFQMDPDWVLKFDKEELDKIQIEEEYPKIFKPMSFSDNRVIRMTEVSLALKHKFALEQAVINNYSNIMVFEDDVLLVKNFSNILDSYLSQLPSDYDIFWIGSCCNLHINKTSIDKFVYESTGSRCTHAYIISRSACEKILEYFNEICEPIDFFFNKAINNLKLKNYWAEPEIVSQNKNFKTSLNL